MICNATLYPWNYEHDLNVQNFPPYVQFGP
jgi:hypothetical protein